MRPEAGHVATQAATAEPGIDHEPSDPETNTIFFLRTIFSQLHNRCYLNRKGKGKPGISVPKRLKTPNMQHPNPEISVLKTPCL